MTYYGLSINNGNKEFYSLKSLRNEFLNDKHLFEFLESEKYLFLDKFNESSRKSAKIYPLKDGKINIVWNDTESEYNGSYGN